MEDNKKNTDLHRYSISYIERNDTKVHDIDYKGKESYKEIIKKFNLGSKDILWYNVIMLDN